MERPGLLDAFAAYGATLEDEEFAYTAVAADGSVVMSCWSHHLIWDAEGCSHTGSLRRWRANRVGAAIFARHLQLAWDEKRRLRMVIATAADKRKVDYSDNLDEVLKTYVARPDLVGEVASFDGDSYMYRFKKLALR